MHKHTKMYIDHPMIKPNTVERRLYQEVLLGSTSKENSLVVLPTGLGKTIVATLLIAVRLEKHPQSKVVFLAPTKPLVQQHLATCQKILNIDDKELISYTGQLPPNQRAITWNKASIFFMTPQVLQNDIVTSRYDLEDVSLLILDEAHRAVGNYAYTFLVDEYIKQSNHPLVLGITASPGADEAKIKEVCKNLNVMSVEMRTDQSPDVRQYIQPIDIDWRKIILPEKVQQVKEHLEGSFRQKLRVLKSEGQLQSVALQKVKRSDLIKLQGRIRQEIARYSRPPQGLYHSMASVAAAIRLSHAIELLETQGLKAVDQYFNRLEERAKRTGSSKSLQRLIQEVEVITARNTVSQLVKEGFQHPKVIEAIEVINGQLQSNPDSRIILFTQFRDSATDLVTRLKSIPKIKPVRFVGQATRAGDKGLSQKQQGEIVNLFRKGGYNVLVATQVAEEGLDIAECDLVIFYDSVPSGIRFIQRRGRTGRRSKGRVVILIAKGTRDEAYYWSAKHKEEAMKKLLHKRTSSHTRSLLPSEKSITPLDQTRLDRYLQPAEEREKPSKITIVADTRELSSAVTRELVKFGVVINPAQLPIADYLVSDNVAIERKTVDDFASSLVDRRLFNQCAELKRNFNNPILLIEGGSIPSTNRQVHASALFGAASSILLDFQIPIVSAATPQESALLIYALAKREQLEKKRYPHIRGEKAPTTLSQIQEYLVSSIPGIDQTLAQRLLVAFQSIGKLFNTPLEEFTKIKGLGPAKAQKIYDIATIPYTGLDNHSSKEGKVNTKNKTKHRQDEEERSSLYDQS